MERFSPGVARNSVSPAVQSPAFLVQADECRVALSFATCAEPPVQIESSADQCQMGERLWKIAQRFTLGPYLLCVKPKMVGITEHSFKQKHGFIQLFRLSLARTRQGLYQPE